MITKLWRWLFVRACLIPTVALAAAGATAAELPEPGDCAGAGRIERALGNFGYRVVGSGGYVVRKDESVKVQIWQNEERDWMITEAFLTREETCLVRSGIRLHLLY